MEAHCRLEIPVGTLTINNDLTANSGAIMNFTLGTSSDKVAVNGNLNLSGTLNITAGSGFTTTTYTLLTYTGTLNLGSVTLNLPSSTLATIDTNTPGQVNLDVQTLSSAIPSFPGALGFGQAATGAPLRRFRHIMSATPMTAAPARSASAVSHGNRYVLFAASVAPSLWPAP